MPQRIPVANVRRAIFLSLRMTLGQNFRSVTCNAILWCSRGMPGVDVCATLTWSTWNGSALTYITVVAGGYFQYVVLHDVRPFAKCHSRLVTEYADGSEQWEACTRTRSQDLLDLTDTLQLYHCAVGMVPNVKPQWIALSVRAAENSGHILCGLGWLLSICRSGHWRISILPSISIFIPVWAVLVSMLDSCRLRMSRYVQGSCAT